jgi:hypothetical protein
MATTIYKTTSDIGLLQNDQKILSFPSYLGSNARDEAGNDFLYMIIKINNSENGSTLNDDTSKGPVVIPNTQPGIMSGTLATKGNTNTAQNDTNINRRYSADAVGSEQWITKKGLVRLDKVIVLPMPNNLSIDTKVNYDTSSGDAISALGDIASSVSANGWMSTGSALMKSMGASIAAGVVNAAGERAGVNEVTGQDATSAAKLRARGREAVNPKKELLFKDLDFRIYAFEYIFAPKNKAESDMIQEIIRTFRFYALPELSKTKMFYTFPAEFEIIFMKGGEENLTIPRRTPAVLSDVSVSYTPGAATWANLPDGFPPQISISLAFNELELVDRSRVWDKKSVITSGY